jgi:hypothetical protein
MPPTLTELAVTPGAVWAPDGDEDDLDFDELHEATMAAATTTQPIARFENKLSPSWTRPMLAGPGAGDGTPVAPGLRRRSMNEAFSKAECYDQPSNKASRRGSEPWS